MEWTGGGEGGGIEGRDGRKVAVKRKKKVPYGEFVENWIATT